MNTETQNFKRQFTKVGEEWLRTPDDTIKVLREAEELKWQEIGAGITVGAMPGMNIKHVIKELRIPKVDKIAIGGGFGLSCEEDAAFGLYGISAHYKNADVKIYILDDGCACTPLFMDVYEKENIN